VRNLGLQADEALFLFDKLEVAKRCVLAGSVEQVWNGSFSSSTEGGVSNFRGIEVLKAASSRRLSSLTAPQIYNEPASARVLKEA
jgi:hypothetical protein